MFPSHLTHFPATYSPHYPVRLGPSTEVRPPGQVPGLRVLLLPRGSRLHPSSLLWHGRLPSTEPRNPCMDRHRSLFHLSVPQPKNIIYHAGSRHLRRANGYPSGLGEQVPCAYSSVDNLYPRPAGVYPDVENFLFSLTHLKTLYLHRLSSSSYGPDGAGLTDAVLLHLGQLPTLETLDIELP